MDLVEIYKNYLAQIEEEALGYLHELVDINSQTINAQGVNLVGQKCTEIFSLLGFESKVISPKLDPNYGDYVFLTHKGTSGKNIAFVSHLDTVFSEKEEKENHFFWREEGNRIYGPGVSDIKGGTIVIYMILKTFREKLPELFEKYTWNILLNAREEEGTDEFSSYGYDYIDENTRCVLVYEAGGIETIGSNIVEARKGVARFRMDVVGRQAHSGTDHRRGANALLELAQNIVKIEQATCYETGLTYNIGVVEGGSAINRVPDQAHCYIDIRTKTKEDFKKAVKFIKSFAGKGTVKSKTGDFTCKTFVHQMPSYPCWPQNTNSQKLAEIFVNTGKELGLDIVSKPRAGASDGSFFWQLAPTVDGLGPIGANDHCSIHNPEEGKEQEFIIRNSLVERALLNVVAIQNIDSEKRKSKNVAN